MRKTPSAVHVWLVMIKAMQAMGRYAATTIHSSDLGDSEFRILEILLHKGPLPVNTIGPKVNLTPGSISAAVDRLHRKGLVSRREDAEDRRVRIVALTTEGKKLIGPLFRNHAAAMEKAFSDLTSEELRNFELALKKAGRRAEDLLPQPNRSLRPNESTQEAGSDG
jgi:MarR family 2-MHQ and catechol resistance regulon transcriptional repressor